MTDSTNLSEGQAAQPHPDLMSLDRLVGTWAVSGEAEGTVVYEWTEGGFFLLQHVDLGGNKGLEVIGHEHRYGEDPSADIRSRFYGFSEGETLDYTYEIKDDTLTIWMGERNSPAYYEGMFSEDGNELTGAWHYPGGGGYSTVSTRTASAGHLSRGEAADRPQGEGNLRGWCESGMAAHEQQDQRVIGVGRTLGGVGVLPG